MRRISILLLTCLIAGTLHAQIRKPQIGVVQNMENDSLVYAAGYRFMVESIAKCFSPRTLTDEQFSAKLAEMKKMKTNLFAVNLFIPEDLKLVGPDIDEAALLQYVEIVLRRCEAAGVTIVTWGSGGARRVPQGYNPSAAREQFAILALKIAMVAKMHHIILALENLNSTETNFLTTLSDALSLVKFVNHPNLRLCADIYHMLKEEESPSVIEEAGVYVVHCDIAEKEGRTPPGTNGEDFRPYLKALRNIQYAGKIMLECRWKSFAEQGPAAYKNLVAQINAVYR